MALKVLPGAFTLDPHRLARFRREAQMPAALNHPHIGSIYGLERSINGTSVGLRLSKGRRLPIGSQMDPFRWVTRCPLQIRSPMRWRRRTSKGSFIAT